MRESADRNEAMIPQTSGWGNARREASGTERVRPARRFVARRSWLVAGRRNRCTAPSVSNGSAKSRSFSTPARTAAWDLCQSFCSWPQSRKSNVPPGHNRCRNRPPDLLNLPSPLAGEGLGGEGASVARHGPPIRNCKRRRRRSRLPDTTPKRRLAIPRVTADLILRDFSGRETTLKDLAGNHDGRITNGAWVPGTR